MKFIMLSSDTCIKCDMAKKLFAKENVDFTVVDAYSPEGEALVDEYHVDKLPCFINNDNVFYTYDPLTVLVKKDE